MGAKLERGTEMVLKLIAVTSKLRLVCRCVKWNLSLYGKSVLREI